MYAIVKTGGKQYRVEPGQTLLVERLPQAEGETVSLEPLLVLDRVVQDLGELGGKAVAELGEVGTDQGDLGLPLLGVHGEELFEVLL